VCLTSTLSDKYSRLQCFTLTSLLLLTLACMLTTVHHTTVSISLLCVNRTIGLLIGVCKALAMYCRVHVKALEDLHMKWYVTHISTFYSISHTISDGVGAVSSAQCVVVYDNSMPHCSSGSKHVTTVLQ
jgi:predicted solute-binding protein